jgi:RNA polymerase sigma-70 factor (ECF subfamily)
MRIFRKNYTKNSEAELMQFIKSGNKTAFDELYNRYSQKLLMFFYKMLANDHDKAQDFTHDLFIKIIENPNQYDVNRSFDTWIFCLAYNMCKNEYKKLKIRQEHSITEQKTSDISVFINETIDRELYRNQLQKHLEQLDEEHKTIIILRFDEELTIKEIAQIVNCPEGTVKSRIFYTLQTLSAKLAVFNPLNN